MYIGGLFGQFSLKYASSSFKNAISLKNGCRDISFLYEIFDAAFEVKADNPCVSDLKIYFFKV